MNSHPAIAIIAVIVIFWTIYVIIKSFMMIIGPKDN